MHVTAGWIAGWLAGVLFQGAPPAKVEVASAEMRTFQSSTLVLGAAEPYRESRASVAVEGLVEHVAVDVGARVEEGDTLLSLERVTLEWARARSAASLTLATEQLAELEAGSRPEDVREAEAALQAAEALQEEAAQDLARIRSLRQSETVTEQELTVAIARSVTTKAEVARRRAILDRVVAGERKEVLARARAEVEVQRAELGLIEENLRRTELRAPFSGVVVEKLQERGEYLKPGDPAFHLLQLDPVRVIAGIPEELVSRVAVDREVLVRFDALGEAVRGRVEAVVPSGDPRSHTFPVRVLIPNPDHRILPGMNARVSVPAGAAVSRLAVPRDALVQTDRGPGVWVVKDGSASPVAVTVTAEEEGWLGVEGPLSPGDAVIIRGNERLVPGQAVLLVGGTPGGTE